jgi:methionine--tRNA ligase beta chain
MSLESFAPVKPNVPLTLLEQLDFRVGTIESVVEVPGSQKLVELRVNFGNHVRMILVGMKQERADPREVEGKQALFLINLEPRKMAGRISEGMLFDIGYSDGIKPVLAVPEEPVPNGARAG